MRARALVLSAAAVGCGRVGFNAVSDVGPTDAPTDTTDGAMATVCAGPRLVAHWRMDDTSGSTIVDSAGTYDGTWNDGADGDVAQEATTGRRGGALVFDTGRSIFVPGFVVPAEGSISVWLTSTFDDSAAPGGSHPMVIDAPSPRTTVSFAADIGEYGLRTNDVSWQVSYPPPSDLTDWFHLAATWSASGSRLYLDGVLVDANSANALATSPAGLYIGTREGLDRWWFGRIDELRIHDVALVDAEIQELMQCP